VLVIRVFCVCFIFSYVSSDSTWGHIDGSLRQGGVKKFARGWSPLSSGAGSWTRRVVSVAVMTWNLSLFTAPLMIVSVKPICGWWTWSPFFVLISHMSPVLQMTQSGVSLTILFLGRFHLSSRNAATLEAASFTNISSECLILLTLGWSWAEGMFGELPGVTEIHYDHRTQLFHTVWSGEGCIMGMGLFTTGYSMIYSLSSTHHPSLRQCWNLNSGPCAC
jgi:hypothetical protein